MSSNWLGYDLSSSTYGIGGRPNKPNKAIGWVVVILFCGAGVYMYFNDFGMLTPFPFIAAVIVLLWAYEL